jgi:hypothetical protein
MTSDVSVVAVDKMTCDFDMILPEYLVLEWVVFENGERNANDDPLRITRKTTQTLNGVVECECKAANMEFSHFLC